jgi:membrane-associated HD superfamily phosphohydrolase
MQVADCPSEVKALLGCEGRRLLRQMCRRAPGTFFHSSRVLELMQAGGHAQGEREIAAVLMHDVGKLFSPSVFAENAPVDNGCPRPWVIAGHVDFGYQIARDAELDDLTVQGILQHHGTQAVCGTLQRYGGQRPDGSFGFALMMADTIEAAVSGGPFCASDAWNVHTRRMQDGQLDLLDSWMCEDITRDLIHSAEAIGWIKRDQASQTRAA